MNKASNVVKKVQPAMHATVLDETYHARLLESIDHYAGVANVPVSMIHEPMSKYCSQAECLWITKIMAHRDAGQAGLCLTGVNAAHPVEHRMWAMAAALLRNYVDARVVAVNDLMSREKGDEIPDPTVMLLPNFFLAWAGGKPNTNWQVQILQDILMRRMVEKKITIIYIQSMKQFKESFGEGVAGFIEAHWLIL